MAALEYRWRKNADGFAEAKCSCCNQWFEVSREFWYFQRAFNVLVPHSWCKACYRVQAGRGRGMRRKGVTYIRPERGAQIAPAGLDPIAAAQAAFLNLPNNGSLLASPALGFCLEAA